MAKWKHTTDLTSTKCKARRESTEQKAERYFWQGAQANYLELFKLSFKHTDRYLLLYSLSGWSQPLHSSHINFLLAGVSNK